MCVRARARVCVCGLGVIVRGAYLAFIKRIEEYFEPVDVSIGLPTLLLHVENWILFNRSV